MLPEGGRVAECDRGAVGARHNQRDASGLQPDRCVAAETEQQQDGVVGLLGGVGAVDLRLQRGTQRIRPFVFAQRHELDVDNAAYARAISGLHGVLFESPVDYAEALAGKVRQLDSQADRIDIRLPFRKYL